MSIGVVGLKEGQSRKIFDDGSACHVTLVSIEPNIISQLKTKENDGYSAIQISMGSKKQYTKAEKGHMKKANVENAKFVCEWKLDNLTDCKLGEATKLEWLKNINAVDVTATSKGKGFAGCDKRHNFKTQDASHGNSLSHRAPGSIGHCQDPGKVFKGKKMPGRMGATQVTIKNLKIIDFIEDSNLLVLKGAVPGANGAHLVIKPSLKNKVKLNG